MIDAWTHSAARRIWTATGLPDGKPATVGVVVAIASATALVLRPFSTSPLPWTWVVPAAGLCTGLALILRGRSSS